MNKHPLNILDNKLKLRYIFKHKLGQKIGQMDGWACALTSDGVHANAFSFAAPVQMSV